MTIFILLRGFISLLTAPIVKDSHILAGIYFIFLKKRSRRFGIDSLSIPNLELSEQIIKLVVK